MELSSGVLMKRTHTCNALRGTNIEEKVILVGWVNTRRDHGGVIFIDIRDREGLTQLVFNPENNKEIHAIANNLRSEYVIMVSGKVFKRPEGTENKKIPTGEIEIIVDSLEILNESKPLPFPITGDIEVGEDIRLVHRYIDLRRPAMTKALKVRHKVYQAARKVLVDAGFMEVETPMLTKSTPEGARDYLVPSRVYPGKFYALPQSPQLFKQILMVGGIEKYFQIVKCFRDEDLRADRQPEFTQIDIEMSFAEEEDIINITEKLMFEMFSSAIDHKLELPFKSISHKEAMDKYGTDKPDLRWDLELSDISDIVKDLEFRVFSEVLKKKGIVKSINVPGGADFSRKQIDDLGSFAQTLGAKGLAWVKITKDNWEGPIAKFFTQNVRDSIISTMNIKPGDLCLFVADKKETVNDVLSHLRLKIIKMLGLEPKEKFSFCWIVDFPLFNQSKEDGRLLSEHHPFTAPKEEDIGFMKDDPLKVRASSYDLVLNGYEVGSGSIRIHKPKMQQEIFDLLGLDKNEIKERFGFFLEALEYGAPPHGGIAPGLDRIVMIMLGAESIREVIAFPKTQRAICPMTDSPTPVNDKQLKDLGLKLRN